MMEENVVCPYCGGDMWFICDTGGLCYYQCNDCSAESPVTNTPETALKKANQRFTQLQKPSTFDEANSIVCGETIYPKMVFIEFRNAWGESKWEDYNGFINVVKRFPYGCGKNWRPWRVKPSNYERNSAQWEDE